MFKSVSRNILQKTNHLIEKANVVQREAGDLHEVLTKGDTGDSSNLVSDIPVVEREELDDVMMLSWLFYNRV
jgi:hypothetical protein